MPGKSRKIPTFRFMSGFTVNLFVSTGRWIASHSTDRKQVLISYQAIFLYLLDISTPAMIARGAKFGEVNASNLAEFVLVALFPR